MCSTKCIAETIFLLWPVVPVCGQLEPTQVFLFGIVIGLVALAFCLAAGVGLWYCRQLHRNTQTRKELFALNLERIKSFSEGRAQTNIEDVEGAMKSPYYRNARNSKWATQPIFSKHVDSDLARKGRTLMETVGQSSVMGYKPADCTTTASIPLQIWRQKARELIARDVDIILEQEGESQAVSMLSPKSPAVWRGSTFRYNSRLEIFSEVLPAGQANGFSPPPPSKPKLSMATIVNAICKKLRIEKIGYENPVEENLPKLENQKLMRSSPSFIKASQSRLNLSLLKPSENCIKLSQSFHNSQSVVVKAYSENSSSTGPTTCRLVDTDPSVVVTIDTTEHLQRIDNNKHISSKGSMNNMSVSSKLTSKLDQESLKIEERSNNPIVLDENAAVGTPLVKSLSNGDKKSVRKSKQKAARPRAKTKEDKIYPTKNKKAKKEIKNKRTISHKKASEK